MKNKMLKILTVFILLSMFLSEFSFLTLWAATNNTLHFKYESGEKTPFTNPKYDNYPTKYRKASLGEYPAFCADYGKSLPGVDCDLNFKEKMSAEALAVLVYGYPNNVMTEFGLTGEESYEESYLATQMAFWEVVTKTGENKNGLDFSIDDVVASSGYENIMDRIKSAAKKLAESAMNAPYKPNPRILIDSSAYNLVESGDKMVAGPYKVTGYDGGTTTDFTVKEIKASLNNAPSSAIVVDKNKNPKDIFNLGEEIYVVADKADTVANFTLNVDASGNLLSCGKYSGGSSGTQDIAAIITEPITVSQNVNITWQKDTGNITIIKEDQNGNKIPNVRFSVTDLSGQKIAEVVTNSSGRVDLLNIQTGKYIITEISVPQGYKIDTTPKTVIVASGDTVVANYTNNTVIGRLEIIKKDNYNNPIQNVEFEVYTIDGKFIEKLRTNSKGAAFCEGLNEGDYYFVETDAPDNIMLDSTKVSFNISSLNQIATFNLTNEIVEGSLKITKKDEYGELLSGVKFEILDSNKRRIDTITTNNSGIAVSDELSPGTYYYREISNKNSNLILDDNEYKFVIENSGDLVHKRVTNYYKKGSLKIIKVDKSNNPIEGVTFDIYDEDKNKIDSIITNKDGIAVSSNEYRLGTYYYKEVAAPANVLMNTDEKSFVIKSEDQVVEITEVNTIIKGMLKIIKINEEGKPIKGALFDILDASKKVIETITTDENGIAVSSALSKGTYYYSEKSVPEEYVLDTTEYEFNIANETEYVEKTVVNKKKSAKLIIHKLSRDTGEPLKDIRFEILNQSGDVLSSIVTDETGTAQSEDLKVGTYYYKEVSSPSNYVLDSEAKEFKIENENSNVEKTVYNELKKLPVTGSLFSTNVIIIIVVAVTSILLYVIIKMIIAYIKNNR